MPSEWAAAMPALCLSLIPWLHKTFLPQADNVGCAPPRAAKDGAGNPTVGPAPLPVSHPLRTQPSPMPDALAGLSGIRVGGQGWLCLLPERCCFHANIRGTCDNSADSHFPPPLWMGAGSSIAVHYLQPLPGTLVLQTPQSLGGGASVLQLFFSIHACV